LHTASQPRFRDDVGVSEIEAVAVDPGTDIAKATLLERIRQRAYELSQGAESGSAEENWLRAEHDVLHEFGLDDDARRAELLAAIETETRTMLSAQVQAYGHP
jgi:hypothetical protein